MFACNRHETRMFMEGKATGVVRKYGDTCPHMVGDVIALTSQYLDESKRNIPFCKATIISIRPGTIGQFRGDPMIAEMDGYANGNVWLGQMNQIYGGILTNDDKVFHLKLRLEEIDKESGRKGDIEMVMPSNVPVGKEVEMDDDGIQTRFVAPIKEV